MKFTPTQQDLIMHFFRFELAHPSAETVAFLKHFLTETLVDTALAFGAFEAEGDHERMRNARRNYGIAARAMRKLLDHSRVEEEAQRTQEEVAPVEPDIGDQTYRPLLSVFERPHPTA